MRLTLHTLLAWLDDTLPPSEVREIGKQVEETPLAQKLAQKIQKVTRRRRLTVPGQGDSEETDPNTVAAYLDSVLPNDQEVEFEKLCLASDVHLAEVASVHQILSLMGQKAKVPAEARHRMYRLVKGAETSRPMVESPDGRGAPIAPAVREPVVALPPWQAPEPPARSRLQRYGPYAAVAVLLLMLAWSAWSLAPTDRSRPDTGPLVQPRRAPVVVAQAPKPADVAPANAAAEGDAAKDDAAKAEAEKGEEAAAKKGAETKPADGFRTEELAPGTLGRLADSTGSPIRWNSETKAWTLLKPGAVFQKGDRVINLAPFRSTLQLGKARVELADSTEIIVDAPDPNESARLVLVHGRVRLWGTDPAAPVGVAMGDRSVDVTPAAGGTAAVERLGRRRRGQADPLPPRLVVFALDGETAVSAGTNAETPAAGSAIEFRPPDQLIDEREEPAPAWTVEKVDADRGKALVGYFKPDSSPVHALVAALEDDDEATRAQALAGLAAVGQLEIVISALLRPEAPATRRAAAQTLREYADLSLDNTKELRTQLRRFNGEEWCDSVEKMLVGYSAAEAKSADTYATLVKELKNADLGVRQLAIDTLTTLTGRGALGYDPDKPEGEGLKAWQDLQKTGELPGGPAKRPAASPAPATKPAAKPADREDEPKPAPEG